MSFLPISHVVMNMSSCGRKMKNSCQEKNVHHWLQLFNRFDLRTMSSKHRASRKAQIQTPAGPAVEASLSHWLLTVLACC